MIFKREHCKPVSKPSAERLGKELARVKSSFASLTRNDGAYVQVAGGPGLFLLEYRDDAGHYRASQGKPVACHPDGTTLECSAGSITMAQADWFLRNQVAEVLSAFASGLAWPKYVRWNSRHEPQRANDV